MEKKQIVRELHSLARRNFKRRRVVVKGLKDLLQADLVEMIPYAKLNRGYRYILVVINVFSKYVWMEPLKRKTGEEVAKALKKILSKIDGKIKNLQTDLGKEFYNDKVQNVLKTFKVNHYSVYSNKKASVVERVNRTLKEKMWKMFSLQGSYKWYDKLQELVKEYNNTFHRTIKMKPIDVNKKNEKFLIKTVYNFPKVVNLRSKKFNIGDYVRISKHRELFEKGYTPNWSNEIFKIVKWKSTNPIMYYLEDSQGQEIKGGFYEKELQKTKYPDIYLVEKVLKRKGDRVYVKWLGFDKSHNSWIHKSNVL